MSTSSEPSVLRIAIVGGGIGGLATLLGLLKHTSRSVIQPHLYESAPAFAEIGAGVSFGANAVRSMKVVDPALFEAYHQIASKAPLIDVDGQQKVAWHHFLMGMDGRGGKNNLKAMDHICTPYSDNRTHNVHRASFLAEMLKLLPGGTGEGYVTFNKRCLDVEELPDGGIRVHFADGTSVDADAVLGCDGVKSRIRQILLAGEPNVEPQFTGKYAYRGLIPMEDAVAAVGERARTNLMFWGYGGHLVTFPIDKGKTFNTVAFVTQKDGKWEHGNDWVVPSTGPDVLEDYKDWSEPVKKLLSMLKKPDKWGLFDHAPAKTYHKGSKICLLGDCAHASTPHQGAGAGMAIEDAAILTRLLGQIKQPDRDAIGRAFLAYDAVRRPRTQKLVTTSRDAGLLYDFEKPGIEDDVEKMRENATNRYRWLWEFEPDAQCTEAIELMHKKEMIKPAL